MEPMKPMKPMAPMEPMKPMRPMEPQKAWWPEALGSPASSGSQDNARYAYFPDSNRLVVETGGRQRSYDTGGYRIHGFGQRSGSDAPTFDSDKGNVGLDAFKAL